MDWKGALTVGGPFILLVVAWQTKAWKPAASLAFDEPGPEAIAIFFTLAFVAIAFGYWMKLRRRKSLPPTRWSFTVAGPVGLFAEHVGRGGILYGCLRGLRVVAYNDLTLPILDRISVAGALGILLFWAMAQPFR